MNGSRTRQNAGQRTSIAVVATMTMGLLVTGVAGVLLVAGLKIPLGWTVIIAAIYVVPAIGLTRLILRAHPVLIDALIGLPLAFGYQFPLFAVAASFHWQPSTWGLAAAAIGTVPFVAAAAQGKPGGTRASVSWRTVAILGVLMLAGALAVVVSGRDSDDWAYGALVADYSANVPMAASDPILGTDIPMLPRDQFNLWTASLGVADRAANEDPITLLQDELPPVVAVLALGAAFLLGRAVGGSQVWGLVAVFTELAWFAVTTGWPQVGDAFLTRVDQDKIMAWLVLQPLILFVFLELSSYSRRRRVVFGAAAGLGLSALHPVTYLLLLAPLAVWLGLAWIAQRQVAKWMWPATLAFGAGLLTIAIEALGFQGLGPPAGSALANYLQSETVRVTAAHFVFNPNLPPVILNPVLVMDALTITTSLLALLAVGLSRTPATLLVASLPVAVVLLAFNPLVTPILAQLFSEYGGLGLLIRVAWLLPVPLALPALANAWETRTGEHVHIGPLLAVALVVVIQVPQLPHAKDEWQIRRSQDWRDVPGLAPIYQAIGLAARTDDVVLAPKPLEFRIPAHDWQVKMLAYRGAIGTIPHFPRSRVDEASARVTAVSDFFDPHPAGITDSDVATLQTYGVRFLILQSDDPRARQVTTKLPWLHQVAESGGYVLFEAADR
jgi:hypothetical protein